MMEEGGIATVVIGSGIFRDRLAAMNLPRTVITHHPLGRPLGAPGDHKTQQEVILTALNLLENARAGGTIVEMPSRYHPQYRSV
jgi:hypothetical protein